MTEIVDIVHDIVLADRIVKMRKLAGSTGILTNRVLSFIYGNKSLNLIR